MASDVQTNNSWFQEGLDGRMKKSFTPLQKVTSAIKQLATGNPPDENDEYLNMAERTSRECLDYFCETVCNLYASEYLRRPTSHDVALLYQAHKNIHHLPRMLSSLDCTHFVWRMYPTELRGQSMSGITDTRQLCSKWWPLKICGFGMLFVVHQVHKMTSSAPSISVISYSMKWNCTKMPILREQPLVQAWILSYRWNLPYVVRVCEIIFVSSHSERKEVQDATQGGKKRRGMGFWCSKGKIGVLNRPMCATSVKKIKNVVYVCIIMHNMILKDDRNAIAPVHIRDPPVEPVFDENVYNELIDEDTHYRLKYDLVEHVGEQDLPHLLADSDDD